MRIFVAGATGALGAPLVRALLARGHDVTGMTRSAAKADALRAAGATPPPSPTRSTATRWSRRSPRHGPTSSSTSSPRSPASRACATSTAGSRSRTGCGPRAPSTCSRRRSPPARAGSWRSRSRAGRRSAAAARSRRRTTRSTPTRSRPCARRSPRSGAARRSSRTTEGIEGIALRYGGFYGPGTGLGAGGEQLEMVRKRRFPVVGDGGGVWSFIHIDDAVAATVAAIERGAPGVFNVTDDDPAPVRDWLPALAAAAGAPPPRHVPRWLGRLAAGEAVVAMMTEIRGASNAKARRELRLDSGAPDLARGLPDGARLGETLLEDGLQREPVVLAGDGLLQPQPRRRPVELEEADLVVEVRAVVRQPPADRRRRRRRRRARAARPTSAPGLRAREPDRAPLVVVERVAERRAGRLVDGGAHARRRAGSRPRRGRRGGRRPTARRSTPARVPSSPLPTVAHERHDALERRPERGPVLEVDAPGGASRRPAPPARPRRRCRPPRSTPRGSAAPGASRNGSDVPISRWSKSPVRVLLEPLPLLRVEHRAVLGRVEHPARARVDHDQPRAAEVAAVAPARARHLAVGAERELAQQRPAVLGRAQPRVEVVLRQVLRRRGCPCAGRASRSRSRRRCARPTSRSRASSSTHVVRRVPVVVDVVVVEDHRRRHRREQPADVRLATTTSR